MRRFRTILGFELRGYFTNKVFVAVTVVLVVAIAAVLFFPRASALVTDIFGDDAADGTEEGDESEEINRDELPLMLVSAPDDIESTVIDSFSSAFLNYNVKPADTDDVDAIKKSVSDGDAECAFVLGSMTSYTYYSTTNSLFDSNTMVADETLRSLAMVSEMMSAGISPEEAGSILATVIESETVTLGASGDGDLSGGVDFISSLIYTYIMVYALYIVILVYGQMVATSVATEKSSRAMELLVTSTDPVSMMFGKVFAACIAGLTQIAAVFGTALVCFAVNEPWWGDNMVVRSIFDMPLSLLLYMLLFFLLGFLVFAFMFGAIGSTVSKLEELNTASMPVVLIFVVGLMVVVFGMSSGNIDSTVMRVFSYIPFTSPMAMFTRIAMGSVPAYEIAISVAILSVSVFIIGYVSAKIYRIGVLLYGTPPKPSAIIKALRRA